jgi:hypothetical protein
MAFSSPISGIVTVIKILCVCRISNSDLAGDDACLMMYLIPLFCISGQVRLSSRCLLLLLRLVIQPLFSDPSFHCFILLITRTSCPSAAIKNYFEQCDGISPHFAFPSVPWFSSRPFCSETCYQNSFWASVVAYSYYMPVSLQNCNTCLRYQISVYVSSVHFCTEPYSPNAINWYWFEYSLKDFSLTVNGNFFLTFICLRRSYISYDLGSRTVRS